MQTRDAAAGAVLKCCFCGCENPTAVHMMGFSQQHIRGRNAVHTGQKRYLQPGLRGVGFAASEVFHEFGTMYTVPVGEQHSLQADTALARGSLSLCGDELLAKQAFVLDTSASAPPITGNLAGVKSSAAVTDGYACARREAQEAQRQICSEQIEGLSPLCKEHLGERKRPRFLATLQLRHCSAVEVTNMRSQSRGRVY